MCARVVEARQCLIVEEKIQGRGIACVGHVGVKPEAFVVAPHQVQHEVRVIAQAHGKLFQRLLLGFGARGLVISRFEPLYPGHDLGHGLAIPLWHRRAIEDHEIGVAYHQTVRKAVTGFPAGEVTAGTAVHPLLAKLLDPVRVVQQRLPSLNIIVFFGNQLGGRFHLLIEGADDTI